MTLTEKQCQVLQKVVYGEHWHTWEDKRYGCVEAGLDCTCAETDVACPLNHTFTTPQEWHDCWQFILDEKRHPEWTLNDLLRWIFPIRVGNLQGYQFLLLDGPHVQRLINNLPALLADWLIEKGER